MTLKQILEDSYFNVGVAIARTLFLKDDQNAGMDRLMDVCKAKPTDTKITKTSNSEINSTAEREF